MKTKTNISFLISLCLFIAAIGLVVYVLYQIEIRTNLIKTHYAEDTQSLNLNSAAKLKKEQESLLQKEKIFKKTFLSQDEIIPFIGNLEAIASESAIKIEITKVEKGTEETVGSSYKIQPISFYVSLDGELKNTISFIQKITDQEKILELKEFKVYKISDASNMHNTRIILTGNILII
ncbi:MAG: hypothetical protein RLZZ517_157 [Candidatus Parcubacteria bacterium]|jgi:predicted PurR-regulated permease PerM